MTRDARWRTFVVVNPAAGAGTTGRRWDRIASEIRRAVGPFESAFTEAPGHATELTRAALADGFGMVVAVGGDGTLGEVAGGFCSARRPVAPPAVLGIVPHGTGSDLARALGIGTTLDDACARLSRRQPWPIDVGRVSYIGHDGRPTARVFLNVASFGCGGAVAHAVTRVTKRLGGKLGYAVATAVALVRYRDQPVVVAVDGERQERMKVTCLAVCNGRYFGGGMLVAPYARMDDGHLDVTIWAGFGLRDFLLKRRALYRGTHVDEPRTRIARARTLVASSVERVLLEADGESIGSLPATFEILPGALRVQV
jgi:YegS/Rv2252/BmrU family lipid kinase